MYLCCLSSVITKDVVKIVIGHRTPFIVINDVNIENEWYTSYVLLYAKKIYDDDNMKILRLLGNLNHTQNGFFRNTLNEIINVFNNLDGEILFTQQDNN